MNVITKLPESLGQLPVDAFVQKAAEYPVEEALALLEAAGPTMLIGDKHILLLTDTVRVFSEVRRRAPSLKDSLVNVTGAVSRAVTAATIGQQVLATEEVAKSRIAKCQTCPHFRNGFCADVVRPDGSVEKGCGCLLAAKVKLATEACPQGKW